MTPLALSNPALLRPTRSDDYLMWFPIIGWVISAVRLNNRIWKAMDEVENALERRACFPADAWQQAGVDPIKAEAISLGLQWGMDWLPNHYFLPDDPLELLMLDFDRMGWLHGCFAVEKVCRVTVDHQSFTIKSMFGDMVANSHDRPAADRTISVEHYPRAKSRNKKPGCLGRSISLSAMVGMFLAGSAILVAAIDGYTSGIVP